MSTERQPRTPTVKGPASWFTGDVWFDAYYAGTEPSRARLNLVRFAPGAHTAWHRHAVGQAPALHQLDHALLAHPVGVEAGELLLEQVVPGHSRYQVRAVSDISFGRMLSGTISSSSSIWSR